MYRMGVGGARDAGQAIIKFGRDILEAEGEKFLEASGLRAIDQEGNLSKIRLSIPAPRLPEVAEPKTFAAQLGRDFVQFGVGYLASPNKFGVLNPILRSGSADAAFFDPEEGGFIRPLIDLGVLPEAMEFLAVDDVNEESLAEDRLKARLQMAGEGALAGGLVDGMIKTLKIIKNDKRLLRASVMSIAGATGATINPDAAEGMPIKTLIKSLSQAETDAITKTAKKRKAKDKKNISDDDLVQTVTDEALRIKNAYPTGDGWLPININPEGTAPTFKLKKNGSIAIKWQEPSYQFHLPSNYVGTNKKPKPDEVAAHKAALVDRTVNDVQAVVDRAKAGDQDAIEIINQANWYRSMRTRLRQEFGGLGDVFADVIGATSAQTGVQQNYDNALVILRRFSRGEFDSEIAAYQKMVADGEPLDQKTLTELHKDPNSPFKLITKAGGELFNTNSPAATGAILDMFRQIKVGQAPKTINFTGNLIGYGNEATIDVWAARYLRDAAGLPRIPPPAEKAVAGKHLTGSNMDNPRIGGEFGFGQEVFADAAERINSSGMIRDVNADLGDLGADDLQAVIWFLEKEKWTKNGWTSKIGEGGSLDYESVYGGSPDRARVAELRSIINKKGSTPEQIADAKAELETLQGAPQRFTAGVSMERPNQRPTNPEQAQLASELTAPLRDDQKVIGYQANNTYGEFMGEAERALNFEVVTQTDFDPTNMTKALVEAGRKYDQDAVFISKVVPSGTANARPGVEIYFRDRQGADYAQQITALLRERGIDGFTFVTDARQMDRVDVQAAGDEDIAGLVGIRFQYIPEFDDGFDATRQQDIFDEKAEVFADVMEDIGKIDGVTYADVVYYDTTVFKNTDRSGTEWINGGTSYEEHLRGVAGEAAGEVGGQGDLFGQAAP
ncbi:MAG: hypothetical protein ACPGRU_00135 [Candidatus Puniceispirillaceae bacterium]